ncbi:Lactation elevated protein 1 [Termitomyces sp. J132]|nr:Lactation elevated protein 1 [Termitomyces sp. J132]
MGEYQKLNASGALRGDEHQTRIIQKLQDLHDKLIDYNPPKIPELTQSNSLLSRLFTRNVQLPTCPPKNAPNGLYLYGDVGTGKTMLMDLFYKTLPGSITRKRRVHFHAFMIDVHKRVHAAKIAMGFNGGDPILPVARDLANEACVLCFDEFQVTDIADAMILRRLLESMVNFGVVCVMTSNRHPDDLYKNGIQRSSFVPAIELIKSHFEVTDLDSGTDTLDYRRIPRALSHVYYDPLTAENAREIDKVFRALTSADPVIHNRTLNTWGRTITIPESTSEIAKFSFDELCGQPLSAADYLEVTKKFGTIFVLDVPKMGLDSKDKARRFITFIDEPCLSLLTFLDRADVLQTKLFVTSEVPIHRVFSDDGSKPVSDHMRSVMDDLGLSGEVVGSSSMFTGEEEVFAFARACSRLVEMGSREWSRH